MRGLLSIFVIVAAVMAAGTVAAVGVNTPDNTGLEALPPIAGAPCGDRLWCTSFAEEPNTSWWADGEWNPALPADANVGWVATSALVTKTGELCELNALCDPMINKVTRGFCWDPDAASGEYWVSSWHIPPDFSGALTHVDDATCTIINDFVGFGPDPDTGLPWQFTGLATDYASGTIWGITRNNPAGTVTRFVELNPTTNPPTVIQGPIVVPWPEGPASTGAAGLEYRASDCTLVVLRQDVGSPPGAGIARILIFSDNNPGVSYLGECQISLTAHCTSNNDPTNPNHPWGIAVIESTPGFEYALFSEINLDAACAPPTPGPGVVGDLHFVSLPSGVVGECIPTAVEPTTWGAIKNSYKR
jgi:hypothetical protein